MKLFIGVKTEAELFVAFLKIIRKAMTPVLIKSKKLSLCKTGFLSQVIPIRQISQAWKKEKKRKKKIKALGIYTLCHGTFLVLSDASC